MARTQASYHVYPDWYFQHSDASSVPGFIAIDKFDTQSVAQSVVTFTTPPFTTVNVPTPVRDKRRERRKRAKLLRKASKG